VTDYIYCLRCPETGDVRYIGKTKNPKTRLASHVSKAKSMHLKHHCSDWIRSLLSKGFRPEFEIIFEVPIGEDWEFHEKRLVTEYREAGQSLVNLTGGGRGFFDPSPSILALRGEARRKYLKDNPEAKDALGAAVAASWADPIRRAERIDAIKTAWKDPEKRRRFLDGMRDEGAIKRRSAASKRRYENPAAVAKQSERMKEIWNTPERRQEASERSQAAWADPEVTERRVAAIKATYAKPEVRQRASEINREIGARPEVKRAKSEKSAAAWQDEKYRSSILATLQSDEFKSDQAERLKSRWKDPDHRQKMQAARWTPEKRREQAERLAQRQKKIQETMTDEVIERRNASIKASWARRKAAKDGAD